MNTFELKKLKEKNQLLKSITQMTSLGLVYEYPQAECELCTWGILSKLLPVYSLASRLLDDLFEAQVYLQHIRLK